MLPSSRVRLRKGRHSSCLPLSSSVIPSAIKNDKRHLLPWAKETVDEKHVGLKSGSGNDVPDTAAKPADAARQRREERRQRTAPRTGTLRDSEANLSDLEKLAFHDAERKNPNWGGFGQGEMKWYALWINTTHEEEVGMDLADSISNLGAIKDANGEKLERVANPWVPTKMAMKWNGRSRKLTEQPVKYGGGNWLFIECIMDDAVYKLLEQMPVVNSFRKDSCIELRDGLGAMKSFPKPLSPEFLASVETWLQERNDDDLAEVKMELYGVEAHEDTRTKNERLDGDAEFVETYVADEVDEKGERVRVQRSRYKTEVEYSGTYENPSGWFDASLDDSGDDGPAGAKLGRCGKRDADVAAGAKAAARAEPAAVPAAGGTPRDAFMGNDADLFDDFDDMAWVGAADAGAATGDAGGWDGWGDSAAGGLGAKDAAVAVGGRGDSKSADRLDDAAAPATAGKGWDGGVPAAASAGVEGGAGGGLWDSADLGGAGLDGDSWWGGGGMGDAGRDTGSRKSAARAEPSTGASVWEDIFDEPVDVWAGSGDDAKPPRGDSTWSPPRGRVRRESRGGRRRSGARGGRGGSIWDIEEDLAKERQFQQRDSGRRGGRGGRFDDSGRGGSERRSGEVPGRGRGRGGRNSWMYDDDAWRDDGAAAGVRPRWGAEDAAAALWADGGRRIGLRTKEESPREEVPAEVKEQQALDSLNMVVEATLEGKPMPPAEPVGGGGRSWGGAQAEEEATVGAGGRGGRRGWDDGGSREDRQGRRGGQWEERGERGGRWDNRRERGGRWEDRGERGGRWQDRGGDRGGQWEDRRGRGGRWENRQERGGRWEDVSGRGENRRGQWEDRGDQWVDRRERGGRRENRRDRGGRWEDRGGRGDDRRGQWEDRRERGGRWQNQDDRGERRGARRGTWDEDDMAPNDGWDRRGGRGRGRESGRGRGRESGRGRGRGRQFDRRDGDRFDMHGAPWEERDGGWQTARGGGRKERGRGREAGGRGGGDAWGDIGGPAVPGVGGVADGDWFGGDSWLSDVFGDDAAVMPQQQRGDGRDGAKRQGQGQGSAPVPAASDRGLWGDFAGGGGAGDGFGADDFGGWGDMDFTGTLSGAAGDPARSQGLAGGRGAGRGPGAKRAHGSDAFSGSSFDDDFEVFQAGGDVDRLLGELAAGGDFGGDLTWDGGPAAGSGGRGGAQRGKHETPLYDGLTADEAVGAVADEFMDTSRSAGDAGDVWGDDGGWDAVSRNDTRGRGGRGAGRGAGGRRAGRGQSTGQRSLDSFSDEGSVWDFADAFDGPIGGGTAPRGDEWGSWDGAGSKGGNAAEAGGGGDGGVDWDGLNDLSGDPFKVPGGQSSGKAAADVPVGSKIEVTNEKSPFEGMQGVVKGHVDEGHVEAELDVFGMKTKKIISVDEIAETDK
eukprot:jgi/Ulvmu1/5838/UM025_0096.1